VLAAHDPARLDQKLGVSFPRVWRFLPAYDGMFTWLLDSGNSMAYLEHMQEATRWTRRSSGSTVGLYTTTIVLTNGGRIFGRANTREAANAEADRRLENYLAIQTK
jgi:hypothetical protein